MISSKLASRDRDFSHFVDANSTDSIESSHLLSTTQSNCSVECVIAQIDGNLWCLKL